MSVTEYPFNEVFQDVSSGNTKVQKSNYLPEGAFPIIDQGNSKVAGFTNDQNALFHKTDLPVVLFGDHTRRVKFVDYPFAMGADGLKVLKPCAGLNPRFTYHALRNLRLADAGYDRHFKYLKRSSFPIIGDEAEQKRIAAILDKADGIRRKRQQALRLTDDFLRSVLLDMFGDPVTNPMGWDNGTLGDLVERLDGGKNIAESTSETTYRVLKVSAVTYGDYRPHESKFVPDDFNVPESYLVKTGDLLVSRANTRELIGATAFVWDTPANIMLPDKVWKFVWRDHDTTDPLFVHALTRFPGIQAEIGKRASGSSGSMKNIAKPKLLSLPIPIPPPEKQKAFGDIARKLHTTRKRFADTTTSPEDLFSSLQQRAFRGEL